MDKVLNIFLVITGFLVVGGIVYSILDFFNILSVDWMRSILAVIITLILGIIILKRKTQK